MSADERTRRGFSLKRWSQRKLEAAAAAEPADIRPIPAAPPAPAAEQSIDPMKVDAPVAGGASELPPVESLTFDADFTRFLAPKVDENLKRAALKMLFRDPRFNVMDGLDVYIDDYTKPDPISPDVVRTLVQSRYIFDPPKTRVNEKGEVEDVPDPLESPPEATALAAASVEGPPSTEPPPSTKPSAAACAPEARRKVDEGSESKDSTDPQ